MKCKIINFLICVNSEGKLNINKLFAYIFVYIFICARLDINVQKQLINTLKKFELNYFQHFPCWTILLRHLKNNWRLRFGFWVNWHGEAKYYQSWCTSLALATMPFGRVKQTDIHLIMSQIRTHGIICRTRA